MDNVTSAIMTNVTSNVTASDNVYEKFDPNANVPLWVNVTVPIVGGVLFLAVLWILYEIDTEIPVEKLEAFVSHIPVLNTYLTTDFVPSKDDNDDKSRQKKSKTSESDKQNGRESEQKSGQEDKPEATTSNGVISQKSKKIQQDIAKAAANEGIDEKQGYTNTVFTVEYNKSEEAVIKKTTEAEVNEESNIVESSRM